MEKLPRRAEDSPKDDTGKVLRERAETLASEGTAAPPENLEVLSPEVARRAIHELRVHQIELELQNEELRRTQEALENSRARYFDLYDLAPVGYFTLSEHGLIVEANLTVAKLLGVTRSALVNQPLSRFVPREDQDTFYLHRKALLETGSPQLWELRMLRDNSATFWVRLQATVTRGPQGEFLCRAAVSDITEAKRAEQLIRTQSSELQEFAYALTHDLQEPLRMVVTFGELLALEYGGKLGEEADQYVAFSVEGALRIEALLKGLLNYLELTESDSDPLALIDCNRVLSQTLRSLQAVMQQSGARVTSEPLPTVAVKETMLTQLFQNLIANSIKYRGNAAPAIHISAAKVTGAWLFSLRDNGIGIDPSDAELVFRMFKRLHGKEIPGTGIGLALCRKVVERHGGRIWVESEPGRGATFKFTIPVAEPF